MPIDRSARTAQSVGSIAMHRACDLAASVAELAKAMHASSTLKSVQSNKRADSEVARAFGRARAVSGAALRHPARAELRASRRSALSKLGGSQKNLEAARSRGAPAPKSFRTNFANRMNFLRVPIPQFRDEIFISCAV